MPAHPPPVPIGDTGAPAAADGPAPPDGAALGAVGPPFSGHAAAPGTRPLDASVVAALSRPDWRARLDDLTGGWGLTPTSLAVGAVAVAVAVLALLGPWWEHGTSGGGSVDLPMVDSPSSSTGASAGTSAVTADAGAAVTATGEVASPPSSVPTTVVVHAAGGVVAPGVHRLPAGARVSDLVAAAGGATVDADLDRVNLAAPLVDGSRVHVPRIGEPAVAEVPAVASAPAGSTPVDGAVGGAATGTASPLSLSTASATELEELPGVGPATAAAIIDHRTRTGGFRTVDELLDVRGIGEARLEQLRPLVVP